jgi:hypothetical protein
MHLAHAVRELCKVEDSVHEVVHLRDRFAPNTKDHDWISALAAEGRWAVLSQDGLRKNDLERSALFQISSALLKGIALAPQFPTIRARLD